MKKYLVILLISIFSLALCAFSVRKGSILYVDGQPYQISKMHCMDDGTCILLFRKGD